MKFIFLLLILPFSLDAQPQLTIDKGKVKTLVQTWSDAHNSNDIEVFNKLYGSHVLFYTQNLKKEACLENKAKILSASNFHQDITSDLIISAYEGGAVKCEFTKRVRYNSAEKSYPSYLLLRQVNTGYVIVGESDLITDRNLKYRLDLGERVATREGPLTPMQTDQQDAPKQTTANLLWVALALISVAVALAGLFGSIRRGQEKRKLKKASSIEVVAPAPATDKYEQMGKDFVAFIVRKFDADFFALKRWQADLGIDGRFPLANQDPDLEFLYLNSYPFAVECKFRTKLFNDKFVVESRKLDNYQRFSENNRMAVHIVLGLGGQPSNPAELYIIPLRRFNNTNEFSFGQLQEFKRKSRGNFYYKKENDLLT